MADATTNVPNPSNGVPVDGVTASANGNSFRQTAAIKSADGSDNGITIGSDGNMPTKTVANGTWDYRAGASGSPRAIGATQRVIGIAAHATAAGASMTINGGDAIPIPAGNQIAITPLGNLTAPTLVFLGTDSYFCELVQ